ncbi:potassium channel family protein [Kribbella sp. NPDC050124]|uniref:potassium channel family protein n=1 Tax=Kribbella sp. NPDC050124 TaxID=3364114 RepID=UPI0037899861
MKGAETDYRQLSPRSRRRLATRSLMRSLLVSVVIVAGYFLLPMRVDSALPLAALAGGLVVVGLVLGWQILDIARSPYPRVRAIGALATSVPLFLAIFATTYYLMADADPASFSQPINRLDSAYFTVTVFATVGFGDIVAVSGPARAVCIIQMFGDLILVGLVARILLGAVQHNLSRRE